ncbi:MAG: hypothetical protein ACI8P0_006585 [Planctomycetaceae bacterium]
MRLLSLDIPDDHAELASWLERHLVGLELRDLVVELEAIRDEAIQSTTMDEMIGTKLSEVLEAGLVTLSPVQLRSLFANPVILFELQERVLIDGGEYWESIPISDDHQQTVDRGWERLQTSIPDRQPLSRRRLLQIVTSVAAAVVVGGIVWLNQPPAGPSWGWDRPDALTVDLDASDYLNHLADAADEWFKKPRDTQAALAKRLSDFRHGCDTLIEAPHPQLSNDDREWLIGKCKAWSGKLDEHLAALAAGRPVAEVSQAADETLQKLSDALRTRVSPTGLEHTSV